MSKTGLNFHFTFLSGFDIKVILDSLNELECSLFLYFLAQLWNYVYVLVFSLWEGFQQFINSLIFMESFYSSLFFLRQLWKHIILRLFPYNQNYPVISIKFFTVLSYSSLFCVFLVHSVKFLLRNNICIVNCCNLKNMPDLRNFTNTSVTTT